MRRKRIVVALALPALIVLVGAFTRPGPPSLSTTVTGDAELAARARPLLPGALDRVSIAVVDGPTVTWANFGANEDTEYEIGSITKTFTGLLLADAIRRGEVTADTKVGALLPLVGGPVADVTLAELASHRSGLSAQGMQLDDTIPFFMRYLTHHNPFVHDLDSVLAIARKATLTNRGDFVYSNLGTALLGHALAAAAHRDYVELVQQRLLTPLGMSATTLPLTAKDLPNDALTGYSADGVAEAPWTINGWAPAGGARSTPRDMVRYARALLDGSAPGMDALTPQWDFGAQQIGYAWQTQLYALWAIMGAFVWRWAGFNTVIYLAGLQSIPREYHEAAMIEGAGGLPRFRHITWPLLLPYTYTVVLLTTMGTLRIFDLMWIMTQGGPAHATETIATYIFTIAFRFLRVGYAQSLAFILLALVVLLTLLLTLTLRKRANEAFS